MSKFGNDLPVLNGEDPKIDVDSRLEAHPVAEMFPLMDPDAFAALKADIDAFGQREPVITHEGKILDGRNRHKACQELGLPLKFHQFGEGDPVAFVVSRNIHRRHLTPSQRAAVAVSVKKLEARLAKERQRKHGETAPGKKNTGGKISTSVNGKARDKAAEQCGANPRYVDEAEKVHDESPETFEELLSGKTTIQQAKRKLNRSKAQETVIVESADEGFVTDLSNLTTKYGTIYADPPWKYGNQATRAAADGHYPTMTLDEICAMPVKELAADKAHLHLWTTNAFLRQAFEVIEAWGFEYKSCFVWVKPQMGIGNYWRVSHEFLLLGVRGGVSAADRSLKSWGEFDRKKHSAKPREVRDFVERLSPGPFLELFGREAPAPGSNWTVFGNQLHVSPSESSRPQSRLD